MNWLSGVIEHIKLWIHTVPCQSEFWTLGTLNIYAHVYTDSLRTSDLNMINVRSTPQDSEAM